MAFAVKDRVKVSTTTTGTGTITLGVADAGYQDFSVIGDGNTTYYAIESGNNWEVGIGTYTATGTTLSRDTIYDSSNGGSAISLSGTSQVFVTYPATQAIIKDDLNTTHSPQFYASNTFYTHSQTVGTDYTVLTNSNAISAGELTIDSGVTVTISSGSRWVIV